MNRYDFYPGDYGRDTSDLTIMEDGIYRRLLDYYYSNEKPIPNDRACLIVRATTEEEKQKTHWVLNRFFTKEEQKPIGFSSGSVWVWRSQRCDKEIEKARRQIEANRKNGQLGGRPKNTDTYQEQKTQLKPNGKPNGLAKQNPNHNPNKTLPSPSPSPSPSTFYLDSNIINSKSAEPTPKTKTIAEEYIDSINGITGRKGNPIKTILPEVEKRLRQGIEPWKIIAAPLILKASTIHPGLWKRENIYSILLRDGSKPVRGINGGPSQPGVDWINSAIEAVDTVHFDAQKVAIAIDLEIWHELKDKIKSFEEPNYAE